METTFLQIEAPISSSSEPQALAQFEGLESQHVRGVVLQADSAPRFVDPIVEACTPWIRGTTEPVSWGSRVRIVTPKAPWWIEDLSPEDPRRKAREARVAAQAPRRFRDAWAVVGYRVSVQDRRGGFFVLPVVVPLGVAEVGDDGAPTGEVLRARRFERSALLPWAALEKVSRELPADLYAALLEPIYARKMPGFDESDALGKRIGIEAACDERLAVWATDFVRLDQASTAGPVNFGCGVAGNVGKEAASMGVAVHEMVEGALPPMRVAEMAVQFTKPLLMRAPVEVRAPTDEEKRTIVSLQKDMSAREVFEANRVAESFGATERLALPMKASSDPLIDTGTVQRFKRDPEEIHTSRKESKAIRLTPVVVDTSERGPRGKRIDTVATDEVSIAGALAAQADGPRWPAAFKRKGPASVVTLADVRSMVFEGASDDEVFDRVPITLEASAVRNIIDDARRDMRADNDARADLLGYPRPGDLIVPDPLALIEHLEIGPHLTHATKRRRTR